MQRFLDHISAIECRVIKGVPFASRNKERLIRRELRQARITCANLVWGDVWSVFKEWLKQNLVKRR